MIDDNPRSRPPTDPREFTTYQIVVLKDRARYLRRYLGLSGKASADKAKSEWGPSLKGEPALDLHIVKGLYYITKLG